MLKMMYGSYIQAIQIIWQEQKIGYLILIASLVVLVYDFCTKMFIIYFCVGHYLNI